MIDRVSVDLPLRRDVGEAVVGRHESLFAVDQDEARTDDAPPLGTDAKLRRETTEIDPLLRGEHGERRTHDQ